MHPRLLTPTFALLFATSAFSAGKELEGTRAAAKTTCPTPEEAAKKMSVPPGYEVRCFAHEPMVVNPVAMTWDSRGRLWVVEGYEYPNGSEYKDNAFGGEAKDDKYHPVPEICKAKDNPLNAMRADHPKIPKDRIVILEDTHNTGVADKRTVFLEGLDMGSAILLGDGGVYVGQQPHLLHFKDTDGDDHADEWRVVLTGFGREDTHELLNSFCWGPDGWLYMTHGVFTNSKVRRPGVPFEKGRKFDAGLGRCRPIAGQNQADKNLAAPFEFEVFADGTSNPWGSDYDARGNFFCSACVIDHFFHLAPGGIYVRQGGAPENPYAYELLPSIVHHKHFRAAYAGVQIYQGGVYPKDTWGHAFIGNIHDNAIHEEILTPVGATFKCDARRDFLRANDGWFRPVSTQTGPDGNLWIMDWCDKYPCYQNAKANPEGVDREKGRIWRVVYTGQPATASSLPEWEKAHDDLESRPGPSSGESSPKQAFSVINEKSAAANKRLDTTEASVPVAEASVPVVEASVPVVEASVPVAEASVPVVEASVPVAEASVPVVETSVPAVETSVPAVEASVPAVETSVPAVETSVSVVETSVPAAETSVPVPKCSLSAANKAPITLNKDWFTTDKVWSGKVGWGPRPFRWSSCLSQYKAEMETLLADLAAALPGPVKIAAPLKTDAPATPSDHSRPETDMDLSKLPTPELVKLLGHSNNWMRRMARRQLVERRDYASIMPLQIQIDNPATDESVALESLWTMMSVRGTWFSKGADGQVIQVQGMWGMTMPKDGGLLPWYLRKGLHYPRLWTLAKPDTRKAVENTFWADANDLTDRMGSKEIPNDYFLSKRLTDSNDPFVLHALAVVLRQSYPQSLTVTVAPTETVDSLAENEADARLSVALPRLLRSAAKFDDRTLHFAVWQAIEPRLAANPAKWTPRLASVLGADNTLCQTLATKSMRRLCDTRQAKNLDLAVAFCEALLKQDKVLVSALAGLEKGQESGIIKPTGETSAFFAKLLAHPSADVRQHAQNLATLWGDPAAIRQLAAKLLDPATPEAEGIAALQTLRKVKTDAARAAYAKLMARSGDFLSPSSSNGGMKPPLLDEVIRAATDLGGDDTPGALLSLWKGLTPAQRTAAAEALVSREAWASSFLDAIKEDKQIKASDVPMTVRRALATHRNAALKKRAEELLGQWHESSADIKALIAAKRKVCLEGEPDLAAGKIIFQTTCMVCHTFLGTGQKVGPDLTGSGRSNLDALLANVIDPNQIIGNGYENIIVTTKDNRTVSGRMVEDTPSHVKLLAIGGTEQIVPRDQVASLVNTHQSVMPVGFGALPDDAFRNLAWYVLAPPEEGPLTKEKKHLLSQGVEGGEAAKKSTGTNWHAIDWESVSLWNPAWKIVAPEFDRTPVKLSDYHGRQNVLLMHPFTKDKPSALERKVKIEKGKLSFFIASHDQGDFELRVKVNDKLVKKQTINHDGERWTHVEVDLSKYAGKEVTLRLENAATGWNNEFSYWSDVKLE